MELCEASVAGAKVLFETYLRSVKWEFIDEDRTKPYPPQLVGDIMESLKISVNYFIDKRWANLKDAKELYPTSQSSFDMFNIIQSCLSEHHNQIDIFRRFLAKLPQLSLRKIRGLIMIMIELELSLKFEKYSWYLYGGMVRDLFSVDEFNDIDIWIDYKTGHKDIAGYLKCRGYQVDFVSTFPKLSHYSLQNEHFKLKVTSLVGEVFDVDIAVGGAFHQIGVDRECNALYLEKTDYHHGRIPEMWYTVAPRVYFPEFPIIVLEKENNGSAKSINPKLVYIEPQHVWSLHTKQVKHDIAIRDHFSMSQYEKLPLEDPQTSKKLGLCQVQKLIKEGNPYCAQKFPDVSEIIKDIKNKIARQIEYCPISVSPYREEHMVAKGYTLVGGVNISAAIPAASEVSGDSTVPVTSDVSALPVTSDVSPDSTVPADSPVPADSNVTADSTVPADSIVPADSTIPAEAPDSPVPTIPTTSKTSSTLTASKTTNVDNLNVITISVQTLTGTAYRIVGETHTTIWNLKWHITKLNGIPWDQQLLVYNGAIIGYHRNNSIYGRESGDDSRTLESYGITNGSVIHLRALL